jgi:hypothetical protein
MEHTAMSAETEHTALAEELAADYARLGKQYTLVKPADVRYFLAAHPGLVPLLLELHPLLVSEFPQAQLSLQVLRHAEVNHGTGHLLAQISTSLPYEEAHNRLNRTVRTCLSTADPAVIQWLLIDVASSIEPESAVDLAERYRQRFSTGHRDYHDLARRFLFSPPDSDERALAAAELEAALARASGHQIPERGGDPHAVLARLRRERKAQDDLSSAQ